jgi:hypothetical protein
MAAGADGTDRPIYPAAFGPHVGGIVMDSEVGAPLIAVGAVNADGTPVPTGNDGPWVSHVRPSTLVSALPSVHDAGPPGLRTPSSAVAADALGSRPDFGVWSAPSFAAPVLAGELAAGLLEAYFAGDAALEPELAVPRVRRAVAGLDRR